MKNDAIDSLCMNPKYFQFLIPDRTIHVVMCDNLEQLPREDIIIMVEPDDKKTIEYFENEIEIKMIDESFLKVYVAE